MVQLVLPPSEGGITVGEQRREGQHEEAVQCGPVRRRCVHLQPRK